jgi:ADP-heptose:LPS heptosyltransferase
VDRKSGTTPQRFAIRFNRYLDAESLAVPGVTFYSLQKGEAEQAKAASLIAFPEEIESLDDTSGLLCSMDLVISTDCVVSHLAGALNIPTWVLIQSDEPYWVWGKTGNTSIWYPNARLFRQRRRDCWGAVFHKMRLALEEVVAQRARKE